MKVKDWREGKSEGFVGGFHRCLGVSDNPPPRRRVVYTVFGWKHAKKTQTSGESRESERGGEGMEGLSTLPLRRTLALILQAVWKMRAIFWFLPEPVLRVMMRND